MIVDGFRCRSSAERSAKYSSRGIGLIESLPNALDGVVRLVVDLDGLSVRFEDQALEFHRAGMPEQVWPNSPLSEIEKENAIDATRQQPQYFFCAN